MMAGGNPLRRSQILPAELSLTKLCSAWLFSWHCGWISACRLHWTSIFDADEICMMLLSLSPKFSDSFMAVAIPFLISSEYYFSVSLRVFARKFVSDPCFDQFHTFLLEERCSFESIGRFNEWLLHCWILDAITEFFSGLREDLSRT